MIDDAVAKLFDTPRESPPDISPPTTESTFGVLGWTGVGLAVLGAAAAEGGFGTPFVSEAAIGDPALDGVAKVKARDLGVSAFVLGVVGAIVLAGGGALVGFEMLRE